MASPIEGSLPQEGESGLEASTEYGPLSEFTLNLAKAMLRTGYYSPDHPESKQSLAGLLDELLAVLDDRPGITFLVQVEGEDRTILIEGYDEVPLALNNIMIRGMSELFEPKLVDFFKRRSLKSFSLGSRIEVDEFNAFVILMSEPPRAGRAREERERVTQALVDQDIIHVSTVFEADLLGQERRLPWRVQLAISRLARDLRVLPLYKSTTAEEIQEIKMQILDEVIRPMQTQELLKDLLVNCDLLARDISVLKETQIEREILQRVLRPLLIPTAREIMLDVEDLEEGEGLQGGESLEMSTRRRLLLRHLLEELIEEELAIDSELLEAMIERNVCALKELPKELRSQVKRHRFIDVFLEREAEYLKAFRSIPPGKEGKQLANVARHVFPELLHRGKHTDAAAVLVAVTAGGKREGVGEAVAKLLKSLRQSARDEDAVKRLIDALGDEDLDRLDRDAVVALLAVAGKKAASGLRELYAKTQDQTVRGSAFDAMMGIGLPALEAFLAELANSEEEWPVVHHILGALGDQTDPALAKPIERFLAHENDHVRHVALTRVFELLGAESEELLIRALDDPGAVTRHAAVAYLGQLQSRNPNVLDFYVAALGVEVPKDESGQSEEVLVEVCRSLAGLGEATLGHGIGLEDFLLDALTHSRSPNCAGTRSGKRTHPFADERDGSGGTVVVARAQPLQCVRLSFSCKTRGSCPSCGARHMAETAAHMVDNVFPHVPVRQFVLSVPKRLRPFLHYRPKTATAVLHILLRALQATLREACPTAPATASLGVVSFLHRFGSSLNPHFHYHLCVVDGLFDATEMDQHPETRSSDLRFHEATDLSPQLLERLQHTVRKRVLRHVRRQGLLEPHEAEDMLTWDHGGGFSLDATVRIEATDRAGLERLIRYCARPPFALTSSVDDPTKCSTSCRCPIPPAARRSASRPWSFWTALPLSFPRPEFIATATTGSSHPMPP